MLAIITITWQIKERSNLDAEQIESHKTWFDNKISSGF